MSVRQVMTRSQKTMRVKFPSQKNNRMIFCESLLERDVARWLELSSQVTSFREQPSIEIYYDEEGNARRYIPDFEATFSDDSVLHIEVKPASTLKRKKVSKKYELIARRYEELGRRFRIITDDLVRCEPLHGNLKLLFLHSRCPIKKDDIERMIGRLSMNNFLTVADAARSIGGENHVYRLLALGFLSTDFQNGIGLDSPVWICKVGGRDDPFCV